MTEMSPNPLLYREARKALYLTFELREAPFSPHRTPPYFEVSEVTFKNPPYEKVLRVTAAGGYSMAWIGYVLQMVPVEYEKGRITRMRSDHYALVVNKENPEEVYYWRFSYVPTNSRDGLNREFVPTDLSEVLERGFRDEDVKKTLEEALQGGT